MDVAANRPSTRAEPSAVAAWSWFAAWAGVGATAALGFVSFALWVFLLPLAAIGALLLARRRPPRGSVAGLLSGAGIALLVVAYIQRAGPGTTCWRTATGGGCMQHLDPRPWLVAGLLMLAAGVTLCAVLRRRVGV